MAVLRKAALIRKYNENQSYLLSESGERNFAASRLKEHGSKFSLLSKYDIFLSHSYDDARIIKQIKEMLEAKGYSVYVDWIEDSHLDSGIRGIRDALSYIDISNIIYYKDRHAT